MIYTTTGKLLNFVQQQGKCTFTEINKEYNCQPQHEPLHHRGGSFTKMLRHLCTQRTRQHSGRVEYLVKCNDGKYGLRGWKK
jgi:hypothetical protein